MTKRVKVWGKDESGELLIPVIYLWKSRAGVHSADNLTGALRHGSTVEVLEEDQSPDGWMRVKKTVKNKGKKHPQEGYVKKSLIKEFSKE
jgi:hypothetical protein